MRNFAEVCDRVASTTKKLEKERIVAEYLSELNDVDLSIGARFLCGAPFALRDQRALNTGFAVIRDTLAEMSPSLAADLGPVLLRTGDVGEAIAELLSNKPALSGSGPSLREACLYFESLASSATTVARRSLTREILERCTPLEAKYLMRILFGEMRIGLQESLVETSIAKAYRVKAAEVQRANMMMGDIGECAVLARHGRLADARMRLLHPLKPMLASPEEDPGKILEYMSGLGFAEDKYDGIRAMIHKEGDDVRMYSRDLDDITLSFPDVVRSLAGVDASFLMDGEIVPFRDGRILTFGELQARLGRKNLTGDILAAVPCRYYAFDLLYARGEPLFDRPLRERKSLLEEIHSANQEAFSVSELAVVKNAQEIEAAFAAARARNNEGLVIKHPESEYTPGKRGKSWLKLKRAMVTLDVVVVAAEYGHGKRRGLLSDYTFAVRSGEVLLPIGKAYSGITDAELDRLTEHFHRISLRRHGHLHEVVPEVVLEIAFDRINRSNRHASGFALRFPRIKRIRWDKKPGEIDTLETVEKLFQSQG